MPRILTLAALLLAAGVLSAETMEERIAATDMANADSVFQLARWCAENGKPSNANKYYFQVIKLDPDHEGARTALGQVRMGERWVRREQVKGAAGPAKPPEGGAAGGETAPPPRRSGRPGPSAAQVAWDLTVPKDPRPGPNPFIEGYLEKAPKLKDDSDEMASTVVTLMREDNWSTALPRLCAAMAKPGYGDCYLGAEIALELIRQQRMPEARLLMPFVAKASEGTTQAEDLAAFAFLAGQLKERKAVPRLIDILQTAGEGLKGDIRSALGAITLLPEADLTPEKAKQWWDTYHDAPEDAAWTDQLRSSDPFVVIEAAKWLAEKRHKAIFPPLFRVLECEMPAAHVKALALLKDCTGTEWAWEPGMTPAQRAQTIEKMRKWWKENERGFVWMQDRLAQARAGSEPVVQQPKKDPLLAQVEKLGSSGAESDQAEVQLKSKGREAVPALLKGLENPMRLVRRKAYDILREVSKQTIPFDPGADDGPRAKQLEVWRKWADKEGLLKDEDDEK